MCPPIMQYGKIKYLAQKLIAFQISTSYVLLYIFVLALIVHALIPDM